MSDKLILPDINGIYHLGPEKKYIIDNKTINHIFNGDIDESTQKGKVQLRGGLHTYNAWVNFKNQRKDIIHGRFFDPDIHKDWYYARELQNGVILLKLPRSIYAKKSSSVKGDPERYYISGYLWKTLFPKNMSKDKVLLIINEALSNVDQDETNEHKIVGYALTQSPFEAIKICLLIDNNRIKTAYPTWGQPQTGNNGKPYSHIDSIGFILAASTVFFDEHNNLFKPPPSVFPLQYTAACIKAGTPEFILRREMITSGMDRANILNSRLNVVGKLANSIHKDELNKVIRYAKDWNVAKDTFYFMREIYNGSIDEIRKDQEYKNSLSIYQNLREILHLFSVYDRKNRTAFALEYIEYFLKIKFIHAGGVDLWETKRIHSFIMDVVIEHHQKDAIAKYIEHLSKSPSRIAAFFDFDLTPFFNDNPYIINLPRIEMPLNQKHFYTFTSNFLGLNYTEFWNHEERLNFCHKKIKQLGENTYILINDCLSFSIGTDFSPFGEKFSNLLIKLLKNKNLELPEKKYIKLIRHDYFRCQVFQRHRILLENKEFLMKEIDYENLNTEFSKKQILVKHELMLISHLNTIFLDNIALFFDRVQDQKLKSETIEMKEKFPFERIPLPKPIPDYIDSWMKNKRYSDPSRKPSLDGSI